MKIISYFFIALVIHLTPSKDYNKMNLLNTFNNQENPQEMSVELQYKFKEMLNEYIKLKFLKMKNEKEYIEDVLKNKQSAMIYAKTIFKIKYPKHDENEKLNFCIGEDETKKLWFVYITPKYQTFGGEIFLIVVKNNAKIAYFEKTK